jgi:PAS domain S-box-containing protein
MIRLLFILNLFFITLFSSPIKKVYTVAFLEDWKPYYMTNSKGELDGYVYELFEEVSKKTNLKFEYKIVNTWNEIFELAKNNQIDIIPNVGITKERESLFNFSQPTDTLKIKLFKRINSYDIKKIEDIKTKNVGVLTPNICNKLISNNITNHKIILNDLRLSIIALSSGELDVLCYPESSLNVKLKELKLENKIISFGKPLREVKRGIAVTKKNFDLLPILNEALTELKVDGSFQSIYSKWFLNEEENTISEETYFIIMAVLFITLLALLSSIYWNNKLKNQYNEQKKLEKRLQNAQDIAKLGHYSYVFSDDRFICSKQIDEILGIEEDSIKNVKLWIKNIHPDDKERVVKYWEESIKNNFEYKIEYRFINNKTKESIWVVVLAEITRDKNYNPITMFGTIQNIDERKKIEEKLSQAMRVFENTHDGIIVTDKDTNIINVNKSFETTTGYTLSEVIDKKPNILRATFNKDSFYTKMWKKINDEGVWSGEIINKKKDGSTYYEILTINAIYGLNNEVKGYIGIFSDISQQKSDEKMLIIHSQVAALVEMLGNISHQWRQPLSVIITCATGLKLNLEIHGNLNTKNVIDSMDMINNQVQYLSKTIDDFRNFFKGDTSDIKEFSLKDAFIKLEQLTKDSLSNNHIKYDYKIENISLILNENLFIQALINIYNNAKDAIISNREDSEDRFLFVETRVIDKNLEISIKDSGNGISLDIIEKIFDPYFTTKHSSIGTGIGLYMTNQIITKQFHGKIIVNNIEINNNDKILNGAEFKIILPLDNI